MKPTPFGYVVVLTLGIAIGIALDDQLLQPQPAPQQALNGARAAGPLNPPAPLAANADPALPPVVEHPPLERPLMRPPGLPLLPEAEPAANPIVGAPHVPKRLGPKLAIDEAALSFGNRERGDRFEQTFTIAENTGTMPLALTNIRSNCSWAAIDRRMMIVPPGEKAELNVRFNLAGLSGHLPGQILFNSSDPSRRHVVVRLEGTSVSQAKLDPGHLDFGFVGGTDPISKTCLVSAERELSFEVIGTRANDDAIKAEVKTITAGKQYEVTVTLTPPLKGPMLHGWVQLTTDQPGEYHRIMIPLHAARAEQGLSQR